MKGMLYRAPKVPWPSLPVGIDNVPVQSLHVSLDEPLDLVVGLFQRRYGREQDRPEVVLSELLAESASVNEDDALLLDQVQDEVLVGLPGSPSQIDVGEHVQSTLGLLRVEQGDLVEPLV